MNWQWCQISYFQHFLCYNIQNQIPPIQDKLCRLNEICEIMKIQTNLIKWHYPSHRDVEINKNRFLSSILPSRKIRANVPKCRQCGKSSDCPSSMCDYTERKKKSNWSWRMVATFKNTSYRSLGERELPVGVRARGRVCMCVCEEWEEERGDEGPAEGKAKRRGDGRRREGREEGSEECKWGGHLCECVLTAGWSWEKLLWRSPELRRCCLLPPDLHTHTQTKINCTSKTKSTRSWLKLKTIFCEYDELPQLHFQFIFGKISCLQAGTEPKVLFVLFDE